MTAYRPQLEQILRSYLPVDALTVDLLLENGTLEHISRNAQVFGEKRFNGFEYFQLDGIAHRYNSDEDGHSVTTGLFKGPSVITPHFARTQNSISIFSLQALIDCTYLTFPAGHWMQLSEAHSQVRLLGRAIVEQEFKRNLNFEVLFRSHQAKVRLLWFREHYAGLENMIPHTVIASFLGITPVSFSRLRNELARSGMT
jgi:CRP-like cAMP-binding protein